MTAQIQDEIVIDGCEYRLVLTEGGELFSPAPYGIEPYMFSTGCWQGYYCSYEVVGQALYVKKIKIGLRGEQAEAAQRGLGPLLFGTRPVYCADDGSYVYEVSYQMPYTGKLTIGADFIWDLYVHMGFAPPWNYRTVRELIFEQGVLKENKDVSDLMASIRENTTPGGMSILGTIKSG
jgi:hypothetical protein